MTNVRYAKYQALQKEAGEKVYRGNGGNTDLVDGE